VPQFKLPNGVIPKARLKNGYARDDAIEEISKRRKFKLGHYGADVWSGAKPASVLDDFERLDHPLNGLHVSILRYGRYRHNQVEAFIGDNHPGIEQ
jgi:hypothetical protein